MDYSLETVEVEPNDESPHVIGKEMSFSVKVHNVGTENSGALLLRVYEDDKKIGDINVNILSPGMIS
ncbi:CARDB protein [Anaerovirgula multivorans]|uniref:CARDB protein n=1 Tax=Anaerovirgula multivorans TaxID=312168 RepID=A0A239F1E9_9FIRM|nr:CARDB domain-containing protein [Anaerovirgula multivorans]SNS50368.1 CARDB protein [Anaerovirgula multivorans]